jgi:hypothetical protein
MSATAANFARTPHTTTRLYSWSALLLLNSADTKAGPEAEHSADYKTAASVEARATGPGWLQGCVSLMPHHAIWISQ